MNKDEMLGMGCKIRGKDNPFLSVLLFCCGAAFKEIEIVVVKSGAASSENNL